MIGSLLTFVAASGVVLMLVWILKGLGKDDKEILAAEFAILETEHLLRNQWPWFYAVTKSGCTNTKIHAEIMKKFLLLWKLWHNGNFCYLFGDQLACHQSIEVICECMKEGVLCWLLPANTTHFLQPLDNVPFGRFKAELRKAGNCLWFNRQTTPHETTIAMYAAAYKAESQAFTPWVVSRAFEQTGIFPFLPSKIFALANANASIVEHGKQKAYVTTMKQAAVSVLECSLPKQPVRVVCPRIQASTLFLPYDAIAADTKIKSEKAAKKEAEKKAAEQKVQDKETRLLMLHCMSPGCVKKATGWEAGGSGQCVQHVSTYSARTTRMLLLST